MKRVLTGIQPTNNLHIGNLFGCINLLNEFENDELYLFIADLHSLTTTNYINKNNIYNIMRYYMACCKSKNVYYYLQSSHEYICKLSWILSCHTSVGELERMTQFKDKRSKQVFINAGLMYYPVLMAADILSINPDIIPVGEDQRQHIELTRNIADKFNKDYKSSVFTLPMHYIFESKKIYSLQNPQVKMSKSDANKNAAIFLNDNYEDIQRKIRKAVTDSLPMPTSIDELYNRPAINNLLTIYSLCSSTTLQNTITMFSGASISDFKTALSAKLADYIINIQNTAMTITNDEIDRVLHASQIHINNKMKQQEQQIMALIFESNNTNKTV